MRVENLTQNHRESIVKVARTETYDHTISGLLAKRAELFNEAERIRDRLAEIKNDIGALDRVLGTLGYTGDLDAAMPRQKREVIFGRGELSRAIMSELRHATAPLSSRDIAQDIVAMRGEDARDRKYISDLTKRVSKALRTMKAEGFVRSVADAKGNLSWERRS
jgi:outer membrane translocation and assembly module TamA